MAKEDAIVLNKIRKETKVKPKYRNDLAALIRLVTPVLEAHDMALKFTDYDYTNGMIQSTASFIGECELKCASFAKEDSAHVEVSYMARLSALKTLLGISDYPLKDEAAAVETKPNDLITQREIFDLVAKLKAKGLNENVVLDRYKVSGLQHLTHEQYKRALKGLEATCSQKGR